MTKRSLSDTVAFYLLFLTLLFPIITIAVLIICRNVVTPTQAGIILAIFALYLPVEKWMIKRLFPEAHGWLPLLLSNFVGIKCKCIGNWIEAHANRVDDFVKEEYPLVITIGFVTSAAFFLLIGAGFFN